MRRVITTAVLLFVVSAAPAAAQSFVVGRGGHPGIAVDQAGTAYVAYKVDTYLATDAVELCVLPEAARACAIRTRIAFPGKGYNVGSVGVHLGPQGQLLVVTGRQTGGLDYPIMVATSVDGGRSFGAPVALSDGFAGSSVLLPTGRLGIVGGAAALSTGAPALDGSEAHLDRPTLDDFAPFHSITTLGPTAVVAGSAAVERSRAWLLTAATGLLPSSWTELPAPDSGRQPQVSGGPAGLGVLLESGPLGVHFRRLEPTGWTRPRSLGVPAYDQAFDLVQDGSGRLIATWAIVPVHDSRVRIEATISNDRGATWSSVARLLRTRQRVYGDTFESAVAPDGRGALVYFDDDDNSVGAGALGPVRVVRIRAGRIPVAQRRVGTALVSLRVAADVSCVHEREVTAQLQASVDGRRVSALRHVRRVRFGARATRLGGTASSARYELRRIPTVVTARVTTRAGRHFTLRLRTRACL